MNRVRFLKSRSRVKSKGWAHKTRRCDLCGRPYHRRNLVIVWTGHNPGHRIGWLREELHTCMECTSTAQAQRSLVLVSIGRAVPPLPTASRAGFKKGG